MSGDKFQCPVCGVHQREETWPSVRSAPWADCACSDESTCVTHQVHRDERPNRPRESVLLTRAMDILTGRRRRYQEKKARAEEYEKWRELDWATGD